MPLSMGSSNSPVTLEDDECQGTKRIKTTSKAWDWFEKLPSENKEDLKAKCKHCGKIYSAKYKSGTSHLIRHMESSCPKRLSADIRQYTLSCDTSINGALSLKNYKFDSDELRKAIGMMVVLDEQPFRFVEAMGFKQMMAKARPEFKMMSRFSVKRDILAMYEKEKENVIELLAKCPGRICLTSDTWSSMTDDHYICVTAHFVDNDWRLQKRILRFKLIPPPYDSLCLEDQINLCMTQWSIEHKVFSITLDNVSTNDCMVGRIQARLLGKNYLPCNGAFFHVRCSAHILNLIVQSGFNLISDTIAKLRLGIKYVKLSSLRRKKFYDVAKNLNLDCGKKLCIDCPTRWNSLYYMLEVALNYKSAFIYLGQRDNNFKYSLSEEEWEKVRTLCKFLKVFYDVTCEFSGTKYPTSNLYFKGVWKIQYQLLDVLHGPENFMTDMVKQMQLKFEKYWSDYSLILSCGAILDPRYKVKFIEYCFNKLYMDKNEVDRRVNNVVNTLYSLYDDYLKKSPHFAPPKTVVGTSSKDDEFEDFDSFESVRFRGEMEKSQLDLYLEEPSVDRRNDIDVLEYWSTSSMRYPDLARMARDVLTIPISTVASESTFSTGRRVISPYRSSLKSKTIQALICLQDWMKAYDRKGKGKDNSLESKIEENESNSSDDDEF